MRKYKKSSNNRRYLAKLKAEKLAMAKQAGLIRNKTNKKPCQKKPKLLARAISIVVRHNVHK
jgi:hypothetical protein